MLIEFLCSFTIQVPIETTAISIYCKLIVFYFTCGVCIPYYNQTYPKSLGIEWVENNLYPIINSFKISIPDILCTYIEHISLQISKNINDSNATFLFTGGGVKNKFLILKLKEKLKIHFELQSEEIIDFKEALIFGFLGVLKIRNENNCLKSVTGAEKDHSSGVIFQ